MAAVGSNSPQQLREGKLRHQRNNNLIDNAAVRIIRNSGEKRKKGKTHKQCLLCANGNWEWWRRDLYSPCEPRIRRDGDCPNQNPMVVSYHQAVVVALKMR